MKRGRSKQRRLIADEIRFNIIITQASQNNWFITWFERDANFYYTDFTCCSSSHHGPINKWLIEQTTLVRPFLRFIYLFPNGHFSTLQAQTMSSWEPLENFVAWDTFGSIVFLRAWCLPLILIKKVKHPTLFLGRVSYIFLCFIFIITSNQIH